MVNSIRQNRNRTFTQKKTGVHSPVWETPALCIYFIAFKPLSSILSFPCHMYLIDPVSVSVLAVINSISPLITSCTFFSSGLIYIVPITWTQKLTSHNGHSKYNQKQNFLKHCISSPSVLNIYVKYLSCFMYLLFVFFLYFHYTTF